MKTKLFFAIAVLLFAVCSSNAQTAPKNHGFVVPSTGDFIGVDVRTQNLYLFQEGKETMSFPCGTGVPFDKKLWTPTGHFKVRKLAIDYVSDKYHVPMPYPLMFGPDGEAIHGKKGFMTLAGQGMMQSHGCINLSVENAKKLYQTVKDGCPLYVKGDGLDNLNHLEIVKLFVEVGDTGYQFRIASKTKTAEDVAYARKLFIEKKLLIYPKGEKDNSKCFMGYPFMPPESRMPLKQFESVILTDAEKKQGVHITLD
jgi:hypothetical protein